MGDAVNLDGDALGGVITREPYAGVTSRPTGRRYLGLVGDGQNEPADLALLTADCLGGVALPFAHRWLRELVHR